MRISDSFSAKNITAEQVTDLKQQMPSDKVILLNNKNRVAQF